MGWGFDCYCWSWDFWGLRYLESCFNKETAFFHIELFMMVFAAFQCRKHELNFAQCYVIRYTVD